MRKDFLITLLAVCLLAFINFGASKLGLFWTTWWADVLAHFVGGFVVGCIAWNFKKDAFAHSIPKFLFFVVLVGILWEVFELAFEITSITDIGYWSDTLQDLVMDSLGGIASYRYMIKIYKN